MDAKQFLAALFGPLNDGEGICVRALGGGKVEQKFYGAHAALLQDRDIQKWNTSMSVYFGTAIRDLSSPEKAKKPGCVAITALWADLDAKDFTTPADPKAVTQEERKAGKRLIGLYLKEQLPEALLPPSALVDTGGGYQAYWFLKEPLRIGPDDDHGYTVKTLEEYLAGLQQHIHADPARKDVTSLMRLPGTANVKYPDRPECRVVRLHPERRFNLSDFDESRIAPSPVPPVKATSEDAGQDFPALLEAFKTRGLSIATLGEKHLVTCPWKEAHTLESGPTETALYEPSADNGFAGGFKCQHSHCAERTIADVYKRFIEPAPRLRMSGTKTAEAPAAAKSRLHLVEANTVVPERIEWLWPNRLALGMVHMLVGDMDMGKGLTISGLVATITTGSPWPDDPPGAKRREPRHVLMVCAEDDRELTLVPRLIAAGANLDLVTFIDTVEDTGGKRSVDITKDMALIEDTIRRRRTALFVLDPLNSHLGTIDTYTDNVVRVALDPLVRVAGGHRVSILALMHLGKDANRAAIYRSLGSVAFGSIVRASYCLARDPDDEPGSLRRVFLQVKKNIGPPSSGLVLQIEGTTVPHPDGKEPISTARVVWAKETTTLRADDALGLPQPKEQRAAKLTEAIEFLEAELEAGPKPITDLLTMAKKRRLSESTLWRAREKMRGVEAKKLGLSGGWLWSLEPGYRPVSQRASRGDTAEPF